MNFVLVSTTSATPSEEPPPETVQHLPPKDAVPSRPQDRRWARRKKSDERALIVSSAYPAGMACKILNTSSTGALLEIDPEKSGLALSAADIPDRFTLLFFTYQGRTEVNCAVAHRTQTRLGVRYCSPFKSIAIARSSGYRT
jgi:hypothetical protein